MELQVEEFGLFGGLINSQVISIDPTQQAFEATLEVAGIDLLQEDLGELHEVRVGEVIDRGFEVLRFWNKEVAQDLTMVIDTIVATIERLAS